MRSMRSRTRTKWLLLLCIVSVLAVFSIWGFRLVELFHCDDDIFIYSTYGSELERFVVSDIVKVENGTAVVEITEKVQQDFLKFKSPVKLLCNAPFVNSLRKTSYINNSHEHVASIALLSTGYYAPTREERKATPFIAKLSSGLDCAYTKAMKTVFMDPLYNDFIKELTQLVKEDESWRRDLGFERQFDKSSSKSAFSFSADCEDGQLTSLGVAQHLAVGIRMADSLGESPVIRTFLASVFGKNAKRSLQLTLQRSGANFVGTMATLYALLRRMEMPITLQDLLPRVRVSAIDHEYLCEQTRKADLNATTCKCNAVDLVQKRANEHFDSSLDFALLSDKPEVAGLRKALGALLARFQVPLNEHHRFPEILHALLVPACTLADGAICGNETNRGKSRRSETNCVDRELVAEAAGTFRWLQFFRDAKMQAVLAMLRVYPLATSLFDKLLNLQREGTTVPLEFMVTSSQALSDLLTALHLPVMQSQGMSPFSLPYGSVVTLDVFRTTVRQPGTLVLRMLVNGVNVLRMPSPLCDRTYRGMCDAVDFLQSCHYVLGDVLGSYNYNHACENFAKYN